jgi:hypothetical protein
MFVQEREDEKPPDLILRPCCGVLCAKAHIRGKIFSVGHQREMREK